MISFDEVNKPHWFYSFIYPWFKFIHNHIYYRKFNVVGSENLPKDGEGYLVICNHQNGLNDAMGVLHAISGKRRPVFIARGDIFKKDFLAKALRTLRIMPAFRVRDAGYDGLGQNDAIFEQSARIIGEGDVVALFPEASHQKGHYLSTFKKGFARIAFKVAEESNYEKPLRIVPMAHHYSNYFSAQSKLAIIIGEPFDFTELYELHKEDPNKAIAQLNQKARAKVQELMLDISDREHYQQYELLCGINRDRQMKLMKLRKSYFPNELTADKATVKQLDELKEAKPEAFEQLMNDTKDYGKLLEKLHLRDWILRKRILGEWWLRLPGALILLPFWILGAIVNILPLGLIKLVNTHLIKDRMLHASIQLGVSTAIMPFWYLILFALCWIFSGKLWIAALFLVLCYPSLLLYVRSRVFVIKMYNRSRRFFLKLAGNPLLKKAESLRKDILNIIEENFSQSK